MLSAHGVEYQRRDYFQDRFERAELAQVLGRAGLSPRAALSTRSKAYAALGLANAPLDDDALLDLMVQEPTLLRRPLIVGSTGAVIGLNEAALSALVMRETPTQSS